MQGGTSPIDESAIASTRAFYKEEGREGFRVLGIASRTVPAKARFDRTDETDMVLEGFLQFSTP